MTTSEATSNLPAQFIPGASRTALELPDGCSIDTWESLMTNLQIVHNGIQWWIGDALEFASKQSGHYYDRALQWVMELGYAKKTVVNYRSIASRIDKSRRRDDAEFSLHACIAYIDDYALADLLLSDAINDEWDVTRLREEVRTATGKPAREPKDKTDWRDELLAEAVDYVENTVCECTPECQGPHVNGNEKCPVTNAFDWLKRYRDATQKS